MPVIHATKDSFQKDVLDEAGAVFVDFYADWCGPCKVTAPIIAELANEVKGMKFVKVNVDESQELAGQFSVFSIPTFMIFKGGKVVGQFVGAMGKEGFLSEINKAVTA